MRKMRNKTLWAVLAAAILLLCSADSLAAAQRAVHSFWTSFLPAMLPFFLLAPYLTGPDAQRVFERLFGRAFRFLFRVPGRGAGAVLCGWVAGSPAGSIACAGVGADMEPGEYMRMCFLASGLSPAFLVTAVGSGYLGEQWLGWVLLLSHLGAIAIGGVLLRGFEPKSKSDVRAAGKGASDDLFLNALANLGKVLCSMAVFGVLSALLCRGLGGLLPQWLISGLCEISGGAETIAQSLPGRRECVLFLSAFTGFGGLCVLVQCVGATGVPVRAMLGVKALHAALSVGITWCALRLDAVPAMAVSEDAFGFSCVAAIALVLLCAVCAALWPREGAGEGA